MSTLTFMKPYKVESKLMSNHITFENDSVLIINEKALALRLVAALNGAYNMGRYHELLNKE